MCAVWLLKHTHAAAADLVCTQQNHCPAAAAAVYVYCFCSSKVCPLLIRNDTRALAFSKDKRSRDRLRTMGVYGVRSRTYILLAERQRGERKSGAAFLVRAPHTHYCIKHIKLHLLLIWVRLKTRLVFRSQFLQIMLQPYTKSLLCPC
jgi:hypothetical protein